MGTIALGAAFALVGEKSSNNLTLPGTGSTKAAELLDDKLPQFANGTNPLVMKSADGKLTDGKNKQAVEDTLAAVKKVDGVIDATDPLGPDGASFLSKNEETAYIPVTLDIEPAVLTEAQAQAVLDAGDPAFDAGMEVAVSGYVGDELSKASTASSEAIGILAAMIILLFAFGTVTAMGLPIITAIFGLGAGLSLIGLAGQVIDVPSVAPTLAAMIGLGVGIDYALFIVTRHKLQLKQGIEMRESIARATATAGAAVVFAGATVIIALVSLAAAGIPIVSAMGYTAAIAVLVAVAAATTLLPALLGALGGRINKWRVKLVRTHPDDKQPHGWRQWSGGVAKRPWRSMVAAVVALLVLAAPALNLQLGQVDDSTLPKDTTARQSYDLIAEGFGAGSNAPLLLAVELGSPAKPDPTAIDEVTAQQQQLQQQQQQLVQEGQATGLTPDQAQRRAEQETATQQRQLDLERQQAESAASDPRLTKLERQVGKANDVMSVSPATVDSKGDAAILTAVPNSAPSADATEDLVTDLRTTVIPAALKGTDLTAYVGGQTAGFIDLADRISQKLPLMIAIVVILSFFVLMLAFRSLLVSAKAAAMNLLSVAAAYGVVTFVFQEGHGVELLGLGHAIPIASFVPLMMFAILFGLSMDYEVFLLTQMREHYRKTGKATESVIEGLANTGRVITSAALIMVFVFGSFVLNGDPVVKQFGIGLAIAIAIDATLVRCLLVPAIMVLFGKASWWIPKWLDRILPRINIEGEEYFEKQERVSR